MYEIVTDNLFLKLTKEGTKIMRDNLEIKFVDRYEEKYLTWSKK